MNAIKTGQARHRDPLVDRRLNHKLRDRFDIAIQLLRPTLAKHPTPNGTAMYRVMQQLVVAFPDLSASEIEALLMAVMRTLHDKQGNLDLQIADSGTQGRIAA